MKYNLISGNVITRWIWILPSLFILIDITYNRNNESELIDHILRGYQRQARPLRDPAKPVNVSIDFTLGKILDLVSTLLIIR